MECDFCHQDVPDPCRNEEQVHARAEEHVERCEDAEKDGGLGNGALPGLVVPPVAHQ